MLTTVYRTCRQCTTKVPKIISVDRSGLLNPSYGGSKLQIPKLQRTLTQKIAEFGPITVAGFMREALTNPIDGYYVSQEGVLGTAGDFVTAPEISQVFGELLGIWCVGALQKMGNPRQFTLAELGPGRGTLMKDALRVIRRFNKTADINICLVDSSGPLRRHQAKTLGVSITSHVDDTASTPAEEALPAAGAICSPSGPDTQVQWYGGVQDIPQSGPPVLFLGQEFLDAFPVHQFVFTEGDWREVLVDLANKAATDSSERDKHIYTESQPGVVFQFTTSPKATPASVGLSPLLSYLAPNPCEGTKLEVCADALKAVQLVVHRLHSRSGAALFIDYGRDGYREFTLRGIRQHRFVHPLLLPGTIDLTADVDFAAVRWAVDRSGPDTKPAGESPQSSIIPYGPVTQRDLLYNLGLDARMHSLISAAPDDETAKSIYVSIKRLVDPDAMGTTYKAMALCHRSLGVPPAFPEKP
eukprot:Rmarinus@m.18129